MRVLSDHIFLGRNDVAILEVISTKLVAPFLSSVSQVRGVLRAALRKEENRSDECEFQSERKFRNHR